MRRVLFIICGIYGLVTLLCTKIDDEHIWNNPFDEQGVNFKIPIVIPMNDTIVSIKDSLVLHVGLQEGNAPIVQYLWSFNGGRSWSLGNSDGTYNRYFSKDDTGKHEVLIKVVDSLYLESKPNSFSIKVKNFPPELKPINDTTVALNDKVVLDVKATDPNEPRGIKKYYWDIGADGWDDSTDETSYTFSDPEGGPHTIIWGARDDDDQLTTDTFSILFNRPPNSLVMIEPVNNDTAFFIEFDKVTKKGIIRIHFTAKDPEGEIDTLTYTFYHGEGTDNLSVIYTGTDTTLEISDLTLATIYHWRLHVRDIYGDSGELTGSYITEYIDLIAPVLSLKGDDPLKTSLGVNFMDPGATAIDNTDGDISDKIKISGTINTMEAGTYEITYAVSDSMDNETTDTRTVIVEEYILLDDFETGPPYQSAFGEIFGNDPTNSDSIGYWRAWNYQAGFQPDPNNVNDTAFNSVVVANAGVDSSTGLETWIRIWWAPDAYWGIGVNIKKGTEYYDLSALDSITFYAKNGPNGVTNVIRFECTYPALDTLPIDQRWGHVGKEIILTDSWKKYTLIPDDFTGLAGSPGEGHTWSIAEKNIRTLQFKESTDNRADVHLFLDDIRLYGSFSNHEILHHTLVLIP